MRTGKQRAGRLTSRPYGFGDDAAAADVVRRIFAEFTHPYRHATLSEIAAGLNIDQAATQRGGQWHASTVRYVLRNPVYIELVGGDVFDAAQARLLQLRPGPPR
jgi:hypothetical protein